MKQFLLFTLVLSTANVYAGGLVREVSNLDEFRHIVATNDKVVVDVFADWCGPCRRMKPVFENLSQKYRSAKFIKVNSDMAPQIANELGVEGLPTFVLYSGGQMYKKVQGSNERKLESAIEKLVSSRGMPDQSDD